MMMEPETKNPESGDGRPAASEWENRRLCSDETCIGVIGPNGCCKECGKPYAGDPAADMPKPPPIPVQSLPPASPVADEAAVSEDDWEHRRLCSDETCIGVIGPNGRCKECGKPYVG
jgi:hypothetical protein